MLTYKQFSQQTAKKAGAIMLKYFNNDDIISYKWREVVTIADKEINQMVIDEVALAYPDHSVMGEEWDGGQHAWKYVRCIDPIDGTIAYAHWIPISVFSLALVENGKPVVGCIYQPFLDELYYGETGQWSTCNDIPMHVSQRDMDDKEYMLGQCIRKGMPYNVKLFWDEVFDQWLLTTELWPIAYKWALVAKGCLDWLVFPHTKPYDLAAAKVLVEEAGGIETSLFGKQQRFDQPVQWNIISNGKNHNNLVEWVQRTMK